MLVLSRKVGERVWIGDKISVTIVRVAQGVVRVGIDAPEEMPIVREELRRQMLEDNGAPQPCLPRTRVEL
jgi:carbon storage regulator